MTLIRFSFFLQLSSGNNNTNDEPRRKRQEGSRPNHILLFTIINPVYPITVVSHHNNTYNKNVIFITPCSSFFWSRKTTTTTSTTHTTIQRDKEYWYRNEWMLKYIVRGGGIGSWTWNWKFHQKHVIFYVKSISFQNEHFDCLVCRSCVFSSFLHSVGFFWLVVDVTMRL